MVIDLFSNESPEFHREIFEASEALLQQLGLARGIPTVAVAQNLLRHHVLAKHGGNGRFDEDFDGGFSLVSWMLMAIV